jgi:hypothetical protein
MVLSKQAANKLFMSDQDWNCLGYNYSLRIYSGFLKQSLTQLLHTFTPHLVLLHKLARAEKINFSSKIRISLCIMF